MTKEDNENPMKPDGFEREQPADSPELNMSFSVGRHILFASLVIGFLVFGIGAWAATAEISGAVIAPGSIVVAKNHKKVQHRDGGIVSKINVKNGDRVTAGAVMLRIDDTQINAELGVIRAQLNELVARGSRLNAEINGFKNIVFPKGFENKSAETKKVVLAEKRLFKATKSHIKNQKVQLESQINQLNEEIKGIKSQRNSKNGQLTIITRELKQIEKLHKKNLVSVTRLYSLQREAKRLSGEHGGLISQIARTKGKIAEIKLQILSLDETARLQAQRELRTSETRIAELREREIAAADRLSRTELRAPQSGIVHELTVHTIGGVISSAETVLVIVPSDEQLTIEVKIAPVDIDQVTIGRVAKLHFSAFNQQTTPELHGRVVHISADVATNPDSSQQYYLARIEITEESRKNLIKLDLIPGMPVEAFISTGKRTALSYLAKPITDQLRRTFREE